MPSNTSTERTEVFRGKENVIDVVLHFTSRAKDKIDACIDNTRPLLAIEIKQLRKSFSDAKIRGVRLRYVTEITKDNINYCKELMSIIDELRHIDGIKGNFYISETEYIAPATLHEKGKPASQIIYSNVKEIVEHQQYVFDSFWSRAIPAQQKIKEIDEGIIPDLIEIIQDPARAQEIYLNIINDAAEEILLIFPTTNAFVRQDRIGAMGLAQQAARECNVKVRILMPSHSLTELTLRKLIQRQQQKKNTRSNIDIRYIEQISDAKATILIIDKKISLVMEIKDDTKNTFYEAIGLSTYSNSKAGVLSFVSIFENLWIQTELYQQVKETNKRLEEANEQLKIHDKMQKEFINVAAHELRTPIQPIISLSEIIHSKMKDTELRDLQSVVIRNAKRLKRLTEDILEASKIESQNLELNKEQFDLHYLLSTVADDYRSQIEKTGKSNLNLILCYECAELSTTNNTSKSSSLMIEADKNRLAQVISNLLSNSIKFTEKGIITIATTLRDNKEAKEKQQEKEILVSIKDTGVGISPEMFPKLFTKFASKSFQGTGLGLFISKSIIEAHGGRIWAENNNNADGNDGIEKRGATFTFSLPLSKEQQQR
jgi:two-component system, OmpR family, sensor histidine kinase VicK